MRCRKHFLSVYFFFVCYVAHVFVSFVEQLSLSALWSLDCGQDHPVHGSGGIRSL